MKTDKKPVAAKKTSGRAKGGVARAESLSSEKRSLIAKKAAEARWGVKPPEATHKGSFKDDFGIDVECYVLNDEQKTAVISQRGMGLALGLKDTSGQAFPRFAQGKVIARTLGADLLKNIATPLIFKDPTAVVSAAEQKVHGYDVTVLIDVCKAVVKAEADGKLLGSQAHIAKQAHVILNASAKAGIKGLVYALSGYDATREEIVTAFKFYVQQEAKEYEKEFPPQLYNEWYRLYEIPKFERGRPWEFKNLTVDHVYHPLARSNGKVLELARTSKAKSGDSNRKLHQFLSEIGTKALRTHLGQLLGIARISKDSEEYEQHVRTLFGDQREFDFANK
ncbi:P63C domain-containing protein [Paraburkholderia bryophila]|uniref:Bacteriophage Mx8 p63 C-terminal domain-containing protein n=1 Tax=Paraburkholderia bryophila TaxID=420952 RepID=A0A7Y9W2W4_9BURK|nr:P63C domain-containing protein [Paraburkholderia bryophila]NYH12977.1 hypothetical protein [Paraburkholderia bryophila]